MPINVFLLFPVCVHACGSVCHSVRVEVKEQLGDVSSLLLPRGTQGQNAGPQAWQQAPSVLSQPHPKPPHPMRTLRATTVIF